MRSLIVEDNPSDALMMAETIRAFADVEFATSGHQAQEKLAAAKYDLILLDYFLGDMTGAELMAHDPHLVEVPVIFCSAADDQKIVAQAMGLGARDFVIKGNPEFVPNLRTAVQVILQAKANAAPPMARYALEDSLGHLLSETLERHPECNVAALVSDDDCIIRSRIQFGEDVANMVVRIVHEVHEALGHSTRHLGYRDGRCTISSYHQGLFGIAPLIGGGSIVLATHTALTPLEEFRVMLERLAADVGHAIGEAVDSGGPPVPPTETPVASPRT